MNICLLEPFFTGSHQTWADGYQKVSKHQVDILKLPGFHWKWRMHGGAVSLAQQFLALDTLPDLILATDMLDLSVFLSLTREKSAGIPVALYFHENQLTYPWSPTDPDKKLKRDNHYAFINYTSALSADALFFNSKYHLDAFTEALPAFLHQFPDYQEKHLVESIKNKSRVLPLGLNLKKFDPIKNTSTDSRINILWNHRWEYDKNPEVFFEILNSLKKEGFSFSLSVVGESFNESPTVFKNIQQEFADQLVVFGYQDSFAAYAQVLKQADILPVTSNQDFFGGAVVEAIYCGLYPLLPNRLAYPAHIPEAEQPFHIYDNSDQLLEKMRYLLTQPKANLKKESLIDFVSTYDWTTLGTLYDQTFKNLLA